MQLNSQIDPCVWRECWNPPLPDGHNLRFISDGFPTQFYHNVTYKCLEGYYFAHNRSQHDFEIMCRETGFFGAPIPWPSCKKGTYFTHI